MKVFIYLKKVILKFIKIICYVAILVFSAFKFALVVSKNKDLIINKYKKYYLMMIKWLDLTDAGGFLDRYLKERGFDQVAVYGGGDIGRYLVKSLKGTDITVEYIIDKTICPNQIDGMPVYRPYDKLPIVDAVIVTPIWDYMRIRETVSEQIPCPIISLEEIIAGGNNE